MYVRSTASESAFERRLANLGEPYRAQYPFPALRRIVDFAIPHRKIVIEVDGASHDVPAQRYKDVLTTIALEKLGWKVVRFKNTEIAGWDHSGPSADPDLNSIIIDRLTHRPTLQELETQLQSLPKPVAKPRGRKLAPFPRKGARKKRTPRGNNSEDTKE